MKVWLVEMDDMSEYSPSFYVCKVFDSYEKAKAYVDESNREEEEADYRQYSFSIRGMEVE